MSDNILESNTQVDKGTIILDEIFDINKVSDYYELFNQLLNNEKNIIINAESVQRVDGAALQLLVAFFHEAESLSVNISWKGVSTAFREAAEILALTESLSLPCE